MNDFPTQSQQDTRRNFLKKGSLATGLVLLSPNIPAVHAAGSDVVKIALSGCGGRGTGAAADAMSNKVGVQVRLIALHDAFPERLEASYQALKGRFGDQVDVPPERRFTDLDGYQKLMETDADIVLLCSPPGFRPIHYEAAVKAGKHVFMEKPLAVDAPGVRRIMATNEEAKKKGLRVAVGHHLRHEVKHKEMIRRIWDGEIGRIKYLRAYFNSSGVWVRPRKPGQTEMQYQVNNWYYFTWLSGDHIVEQHVHDLDVLNWMMGNKHPVSAQGMGGRQFRIGKDYGEIYDHHAVEFTYEDGTRAYSYCRHIPGCWDSFSEHAHGTKGYVSIEGHGHAIIHVEGKEPVRVERGPDGHQLEWNDFLAAFQAGQPYNEVDHTILGTMTAILGRMATYSGQIVTWDEAINSKVDLSPSGYTWDSVPQPKPGPDGIYPCAMPGQTKAY
ncbi:MAG: Gfo/Idh/MocA family oxidoreductase [Thermogutta sp.]|uniref:Gfo/Idh/MocA family protein n=1 Tax=Thermogutta sp. TaxID=1962930 RepID=UPI0019BCE2B3|nr:Gfo/Idh/MocA family oxidoreductase [Thermogutta sp.]MBC7351216.1 Gfo/Idh/MocA family oxidoreductase [Thermogutta sp.]